MRFNDACWTLLVTCGLLCGCVDDAPTGTVTAPGPLAELKFKESAKALGLDVDYGFSADYLERLAAAGADAGAARQGDAGVGSDAGSADRGQPGANRVPVREEIALYGGIAAGDFDDDGWKDILVLRGEQPGRLFRNLGDSFADVTDSVELELPRAASGALFADIDGDGFPDLVVGGIESPSVSLFKNVGGKRFERVENPGLVSPTPVHGFAAGDVDGDQDIDLLALRSGAAFADDEVRAGLLFLSDGNGRFEDESPRLYYPLSADRTEAARSAGFSDIDDDGDSDLLIVQDFGASRVFENQTPAKGAAKFADETDLDVIAIERGQGMAVGDYDNDGDMDWFVTGVSAERAHGRKDLEGNRLYRNDGQGGFKDVSETAGISDGSWGAGACFADFNNDGLLDIFHVNGAGFGKETLSADDREFLSDTARLFVQRLEAPGRFVEIASEVNIDESGEGRGVICADFDRDGDVDILVNNIGGSIRLHLNLLNPEQTSGANWLGLQLVGKAPNSGAIGARVHVMAGGATQTREIQLQNTLGAQQSLALHIGLGGVTEVDELRISWPDGADDTVVEGIAVNQNLKIVRK